MDTNWIVAEKTEINNLKNCQLGEIVFCKDTGDYYMYGENGWMKLAIDENSGLSLNLYDLNKSIIEQLKPLTKNEIQERMELIVKYYKNTDNNYYMLLCRDFNYYTIFSYNQDPVVIETDFIDFEDAVYTIITELGEVYSIENTTDNGAIEIWIKPTGEENPFAFYLFPYDAGVVHYE